MRALVIIALIFIMFMVFISAAYSDVNLTPGYAPVQGQSTSRDTFSTLPTLSPGSAVQSASGQQPGVPVTGGECTTGCAYYYPGTISLSSIPVTGACPNPYVVQYGDTLSRLARACGTNVSALLTLNPYIYNADLIYPGQVLWIYAPASGSVPVTGAVVAPTPAPVEVNPIVLNPSLLPVQSGGSLQVKIVNFPPNTSVNLGVGKPGMGYQVVNSGITDASGTLISTVSLPVVNNPLDQWTVIAVTLSGNQVQAASQPFTITTP